MIRRLLYPFEQPHLPPGQVLSPLDAVAERIGERAVEELFQNDRWVRVMAEAMRAYFRDADGELALKKSFHVYYEKRLRNRALVHDPAGNHGFGSMDVPVRPQPLDDAAEADLCAAADRSLPPLHISWLDHCRHWGSAFAWLLVLLGATLFLALKHGLGRAQRLEYDVALPNQGNDTVLQYLRDGARKYGVWRSNGLVTVLENPIHVPPSSEIPIVRPEVLKIPISIWLGEMLPAAARLVFTVAPVLLIRPFDSRVVLIAGECFHLAAIGLKAVPIAANLKVNAYLDTAEYNPIHIVKAMVFRRYETGPLVRLPHSQMDTPGATLSYLGYDIFLSAGPYQSREYGARWRRGCRSASIGMFRNDRYFRDQESVEPSISARIRDELGKHKKIIVFFGPSAMKLLRKPTAAALKAMIAFTNDRDDCFLVIKPKGKTGADWLYTCFGQYDVPGLKTLGENVFLIDYSQPGQEVCPSGWLIDRMTLGVGLGGSAPIESLSAGKPFLVCSPVLQNTEHTNMMRAAGLVTGTGDELSATLAKLVDREALDEQAVQWYRESFDPYFDDCALKRLVETLFRQPLSEQNTV